jgi:phage repressor protein C with HTH and peptisase S24 domain
MKIPQDLQLRSQFGVRGNQMKNTDEQFGNRLRLAIDGESVNSFAKRCGIPEATLRGYLNGKFPASDTALKIADAANVGLGWLIAERGPMRPSVSDPDQANSAQAASRTDDLTLIERLDIEAAAGAGAYFDTEKTLDFVAFQTSWLRSKGINPAATRLLNVKGDSMEPTIRDGDMALVDTSISEIIDNSIYVIIVGQRLLIKRIHVLVTGALRLISDNNLYSPEDVQPNEAEFVRVAGRVMWYGRSI